MKKLYLLLVLAAFSNLLLAQHDYSGARQGGMANTSLTLTDVWSLFNNQAGLGEIESFTAGASYESRFLIKELAYASVAAAMPLGNGAIGLKYGNFGYSVYHEGNLGLGYGMKLTDKLSAGVGINYQTVSISAEDYGNTGAVTAEIGVRMQLSEHVSAAAHLYNPTRSQLDDYNDERLPTVLRLGIGYQLSDELLLAGEAEKDIDKDALFRAGIEYRPAEILFLRLGAATEPTLFTFGLGLRFESFQFDLGTAYNSILGYSPQVSLTFNPAAE